jgi:hypothetical protein
MLIVLLRAINFQKEPRALSSRQWTLHFNLIAIQLLDHDQVSLPNITYV